MMSSSLWATAVLSFAATVLCAEKFNISQPLKSSLVLPSTFTPPQVFKNINLVHVINLEKGFPKESINVVIENNSKDPQAYYYIPFTAEQIEKLGVLEVNDRKAPESGNFQLESIEFDPDSATRFYRVRLPKPLEPGAQQTLSINYVLLSSLNPLPARIAQMDQQFLLYTFSAYALSAYETKKQKTEVKFPSTNVPENTIVGGSPQKSGSKYTYGSFEDIPAGAVEPVRVRYEFTKPLIHVSRIERDVEVSHWGGNVAFEERYSLTNRAATLSTPFSRTKWATQQYQPYTATTAIKDLRFPLKVGSLTPYFTDVIGNVSTSRFRSSKREANLELKPRYPIFGGWNYPFRVGWDADVKKFLRELGGDSYVLNVPFLEGPKQAEGVEYEHVEVRIILPEGAENVKFFTTVPITGSEITKHKTFMDTIGRTMLKVKAINLVDEIRDRELIVTYDYPLSALLRKPLVIFAGVATVFVTAWAVGNLDVSIRARK